MSFKQAFSFSSDDFQAYLQERHIDLTCPVCHKDKFNLMAQNIVELDFEDSEQIKWFIATICTIVGLIVMVMRFVK